MIRGRVTRAEGEGTGLEARVPVDIVDAIGVFRTLEVVVDTGFTGAFTLPERIAEDLGLQSIDTRDVIQASGQIFRAGVCATRLLWHGQPTDVRTYLMGSRPMIGVELLAYCHLAIDWWEGGDVSIEERAPGTASPNS